MSLALMVVLLLTSNKDVQASSEIAPFSIRVTPEHSKVRKGEKIILDIVLTNVSKAPIDLAIIPYETYVAKENGTELKPPGIGMGTSSSYDDWSNVDLNPNETTEDKIVLSNLYDLNIPGTYLIRIGRRELAYCLQPCDLGPEVRSNLIRVTVTN